MKDPQTLHSLLAKENWDIITLHGLHHPTLNFHSLDAAGKRDITIYNRLYQMLKVNSQLSTSFSVISVGKKEKVLISWSLTRIVRREASDNQIDYTA